MPRWLNGRLMELLMLYKTDLQKQIEIHKVNPALQELIDRKVLEAREDREPSGRLSAGKLAYPLQWKMLHYFKVPTEQVDTYTLRKFQRGKDVEDRIVEWVKPEQKQVECMYRNVIGYCDMVTDMPIEVKSTTNRAFTYLQKDGPKLGHKLQGMCYAKALGFDKFQIAYVASDDYRVLSFECEITDEVDKMIDEYEAQLKLGTIPVFKAVEGWNDKKDYNPYFDWMKLSEEQIAKKLATLKVNQ